MPELVDVEGERRRLARHTGTPVTAVHAPDASVLRNTSPQGLGRALHGRTFERTERRGKWLVGWTDGHAAVFHFGMTGQLVWYGGGDSGGGAAGHAHDRVVFELDGGDLAYRAQRKLGGVWLAHGEDEVREITGPTGPDALEVDEDTFLERLGTRRGNLKGALMDQEVVAGLGNELTDEILWRAGTDPHRKVEQLDHDALTALYRTTQEVLHDALPHGRIPAEEGWLESVRGEPGAACPRCGGEVRAERIAGRTSYWCPACQD